MLLFSSLDSKNYSLKTTYSPEIESDPFFAPLIITVNRIINQYQCASTVAKYLINYARL